MKGFTVVALIALGSCVTPPSTPEVFTNPQSYVGQTLTVCGYVRFRFEDLNLWIDRAAWRNRGGWGANEGKGLTIEYTGLDRRLSRMNGHAGCINGRIVWTGCRDDCNYSEFNYGIVPTNVDEHARSR